MAKCHIHMTNKLLEKVASFLTNMFFICVACDIQYFMGAIPTKGKF